MQDAAGNRILAQWNGLGHKTRVDDPNQGTSYFIYNGFGELEKQTDANGRITTFEYDKLGRITRRVADGSVATFGFDRQKKGLPDSEAEHGITRTFGYDALSRPTSSTVTLDGISRTVKTQYDSHAGRPKALVYPNGLTVALDYNDRGDLTTERNAQTGYVYLDITQTDALGNVTQTTLTDGLLTAQATYSLRTGQMTDIRVTHTASSADTLHHLEYTAFDAFGNLIQQQNTLTESFHYDKLHRLTGNTVTYGGQTVQQIDYAWDAVATVLKPDNTPVSFSYDARGNLTTGDGLTATYNTWDKPTRLTRSKQGISTTMAFTYGADLMRYKQVRTTDGISSTTYYIDKLYEETHTAGRTEWKAYISDVAVVGETQQQGRYIAFTHKDRLGSGTTFTDHHGQVVVGSAFKQGFK